VDLESVLLLELSMSLYQRKILSFGKARELSGLSKWQFHEELGKRKIERHYDAVAFEEDLKYGSR
jgi:predicted HTH domain antitoxin